VRGVYADLLGPRAASYDFMLKINGATAMLPVDEQAQLVGVLDGLATGCRSGNLIVNGLLHFAQITVPDKASVADRAPTSSSSSRACLAASPSVRAAGVRRRVGARRRRRPARRRRALTGSREYQSQ